MVAEILSAAGGSGFDSARRWPNRCRRITMEPEEPLVIWGCSIVALGRGKGMPVAEGRIIGCGQGNSQGYARPEELPWLLCFFVCA